MQRAFTLISFEPRSFGFLPRKARTASLMVGRAVLWAAVCTAVAACTESEPRRMSATDRSAQMISRSFAGPRTDRNVTRGPLFLEVDIDENERISAEEAAAVPALAAHFDAFDGDGSGWIDPLEYMDARDSGLLRDAGALARTDESAR